ncbi:pyridoxal phosphate-dependent transferase [Globomyces pollinis-pini]|nr:pyridoxal phosphate-dependent transferase [Globomyces pollinis-pini]
MVKLLTSLGFFLKWDRITSFSIRTYSGMYSGNQNSAQKIRADFRSDTVTKPTDPMLFAMKNALVGDDVFADDPTINEFQDRVAKLAGKEAALFVTSGTLSNQLAIRTHLTQPPYSVVVDERAHVHTYEAGGISFHAGAQVLTLSPAPGVHYLTSDQIEKKLVLDDDVHHAPTQLVCLENTMNGQIFPLEEQQKISKMVHGHGLKLHLDGARLWNAITATGISLKEACDPFDSVSLCFSKGLGAPVGSVLVGNAKFIKKARHFRKLYGGGWRQAGLLASACNYVLDNHLPLLKHDHENAALLAEGLIKLGFKLSIPHETNMVWVDLSSKDLISQDVYDALMAKGILNFGGNDTVLRFVVHHQISKEHIIETIDIISELLNSKE